MPKGIYNHKPHSEETKKKMSESHKGKEFSEETKRKIRESKLGDRNPMKRKAVRDKSSKSHLGHKVLEETKKKIGNSLRGKKSYACKGDDVSYSGLHKWIRRELGSPQKCKGCGAIPKKRKLQWANKDHKYKRNLKDWISFCAFCHQKYDREKNNS